MRTYELDFHFLQIRFRARSAGILTFSLIGETFRWRERERWMIIDDEFLDNDKKGYSCYSTSKGGRAVQGKKMKTDGVKTKHHLDQIRSMVSLIREENIKTYGSVHFS